MSEHRCHPQPCFDCGRGLSRFEYFVIRQFRSLRADVAQVAEQLAELQAEVQLIAGYTRPHPAVGIRASIGGHMDITLDVDVTGETVSARFIDDKNEPTPTGPNGPDGTPATIGFTSSDPTVVTVDPSGALGFLKAGTATITATANDSTGTPVAGFPTGTVNLTLTPGVAAGLEVSVSGAAPVPVPTPEPVPEPVPAPEPAPEPGTSSGA